ncbi:hypothetical protein L0F63_003495 [Massospora cicadina]|nr:hypothetical protein L0F63_003495 [Massospora cicadina]
MLNQNHPPQYLLFTQLPEARKEAEVLLAAFVESPSHHYLDEEVENSYYTDLHPHYADAPTPWLSALIWYCNQHPMIEAGLSENQPSYPFTLCHGGLDMVEPGTNLKVLMHMRPRHFQKSIFDASML